MERPARLSKGFVERVKLPGRYGDGRGGHGLSLLVKPARAGWSKTYSQKLTVNGQRIVIALGPHPLVSLDEVRLQAFANHRAAFEGKDPRRSVRIPTFTDASEKVIANRAAGWKPGSKSGRDWRNALARWAFPVLGALRVDAVTVADVERALRPVWGTEKGRKLRQRIGEVMGWAVAHGYRDDNPADRVAVVLPSVRQKPATHLAALHHSKVGPALQAARSTDAYLGAKLALEFIALTAVRSGEARRAAWDEVDLDAATWTVPADRTKTGAELRVPLSTGAMAVLRRAQELREASGLVFPRARGGGAMIDSKVSDVLRMAGVERATVHGLRSSFRDWCSDRGLSTEAAEIALGHAVGSKVERAYRRTDLLDERRGIMEAWGQYILG